MEELLSAYIRTAYNEDVADSIASAIYLLSNLRPDITINDYGEYIPDVNSSTVESVEPESLRFYIHNRLIETLNRFGVKVEYGLSIRFYAEVLTAIGEVEDEEKQLELRDILEGDQDPVETLCDMLSARSGKPSAFYYGDIQEVEQRLIDHMTSILLPVEKEIDLDPDLIAGLTRARAKVDELTIIETRYRAGLLAGLPIHFYAMLLTKDEYLKPSEMIAMTILSYGMDNIHENAMTTFESLSVTLTERAERELAEMMESQLTLF